MTAKRMTTAEKIRNLQMMKTTGELPQEAENDSQAFTGTTYNAKGDKVRVTVPGSREELVQQLNTSQIFQGLPVKILVQIAKGEIDVELLAKKELASRSLNCSGRDVDQEWANQNVNFYWDRTSSSWMYVPER